MDILGRYVCKFIGKDQAGSNHRAVFRSRGPAPQDHFQGSFPSLLSLILGQLLGHFLSVCIFGSWFQTAENCWHKFEGGLKSFYKLAGGSKPNI
jgi:hypothetical protein